MALVNTKHDRLTKHSLLALITLTTLQSDKRENETLADKDNILKSTNVGAYKALPSYFSASRFHLRLTL